ncbi:MAG: alkaline phosphatase family protein [Actinomycetota bacterium]
MKRVTIIVLIAIVVAAGAFYVLRPERGVPEGAPTEEHMARAVGTDVMRNVYRGHAAGRSGEIMLVPKPHHFMIGSWEPSTIGTDEISRSTSHPNPWSYLARVPIIFTGPGIERGREVTDSVDIGAIAPTMARMLDFDFDTGVEPLDVDDPTKTPRLIFSVVIDGGGWNALQEHPTSWPTIAKLRREGTTFVNATIGSAPSITGALHATFGTGTYPIDHGIPGNQMRGPDGENTDTWLDNADGRYLREPTVSELWDEAHGNRPLVGTVSYEGWHLGMIGRGAQREGADRDHAVLWHVDEMEWYTNEEFYELPAYLQTTDIPTIERYEEELDPRDGLRDGLWFGNDITGLDEEELPLIRPATPAFARFTGDAVVEVLENEPYGRDDLTDFFWVEMKMPDFAGHQYNMIEPEEADVIRETDRQIARFLATLDRRVGRDNYVVMLSADHGQQPLPDTIGGWRIGTDELERDIETRFGNILEKSTPVDIYFDMEAVEREDVDLSDVARFLGTYTVEDNLPEDIAGLDRVPEDRLDDTLFAAAFSTEYLQALTDEDIESFGLGDYGAFGDLTSPPGVVREGIP